jgi:hypothetical protein
MNIQSIFLILEVAMKRKIISPLANVLSVIVILSLSFLVYPPSLVSSAPDLVSSAVTTATFTDVPTTYWAWSEIERLYAAHFTGGCSDNPLAYCPERPVTRAEMAIFIERGIHGSDYNPPAGTGTVFVDVPLSYWDTDWIEQLYADHITGGCWASPLTYCPDSPTTRAEMAVFLLKAKHGVDYNPPAAVGIFTDVPTSYWDASWIEQLYAEEITGGCNSSPLSYCPENQVTRAEMAVFLVKTFSLEPLPAGVYILTNHSSYVDSINYLHIVGEVMNNTDDDLRFVQIIADIFNSGGQILDTDFTYIWLDNLPSRDKTCFDLALLAPVGWSYYQFEPLHYWTDGDPLPNLTVTDHHGSYNSTFGWYEIIGQIRNDEATLVEYVQPVGTAYNGSGTVVGCDFTFVNTTDLNPGQISAFKMTFLGRDFSDVVSYRLQVDGNK